LSPPWPQNSHAATRGDHIGCDAGGRITPSDGIGEWFLPASGWIEKARSDAEQHADVHDVCRGLNRTPQRSSAFSTVAVFRILVDGRPLRTYLEIARFPN
jgi:hypothetical protein